MNISGGVECGLNKLQEPAGSSSLSEIVDEYADNNDAFIRDFIPAFEKMLQNGYERYSCYSLKGLLFNLFILVMNFKIHLTIGLEFPVEDQSMMTDGGIITALRILK